MPQIQRPAVRTEETQRPEMDELVQSDAARVPKGGHVSTEDIDELLADIDRVLEENAAEFVSAYVQKGGQ